MAGGNNLHLDYQGLKDQAEAIKRKRNELETLINNVMTTVGHLKEVWDDAAARDFIQKVESMRKPFENFRDTLQGLSEHMNSVAGTYERLSTEIKAAQSKF